MILIESLQIELLELLLVSFGHSFEPVDHFLMMAPALHFVPCVDEFTHLNIETLGFALVGEQLIRLADQEEVVVELFSWAPMSYAFLAWLFLHLIKNKL